VLRSLQQGACSISAGASEVVLPPGLRRLQVWDFSKRAVEAVNSYIHGMVVPIFGFVPSNIVEAMSNNVSIGDLPDLEFNLLRESSAAW
jgi:hypothetical protein